MMIHGGRSVEGNRFVGEDGDAQAHHQPQGAAGKATSNKGNLTWPRITASVATSHVPAIGAALDNLARLERRLLEAGVRRLRAFPRQWMKDAKPDVVFLVYNDHASAFSAGDDPHLCHRHAPRASAPADEGWGPRPVPKVQGHPELAWHLAQSLILDEFDMTIVNRMDVDHGLTVPLSLMFGQPDAWPCKVIPLAVNVVQYPPPTGPLLPAGPGHRAGGGELPRQTSTSRSGAPAA
jgi:hypothetical protein